MSDPDNGQLNFPILGLAPIVQQFATPQTGLSRADIWVLAMNIALNNANQQPTKNPVTFDMNWIGRVDCEKRSGATCTDGKGKVIPCGPLSGPKRVIAPVNMNSLDFASFWRTNFNNITIRHAVALMGCHTVGRSFTQVSL
jgi:catalase (peroxidase I)